MDQGPGKAHNAALAVWQSCGGPALKKLFRMNLPGQRIKPLTRRVENTGVDDEWGVVRRYHAAIKPLYFTVISKSYSNSLAKRHASAAQNLQVPADLMPLGPDGGPP